ncbi:protein of unknown function [Mucilaginibacter gossypiicola]|uniref:DUF4133 domain-containing protein n=1 Tax=Mucilaginibacter gossypiicola TaxID=551995 RepID=A0A1H8DE48_9SPHI|nr:DUF4133 domain-containing protein [Mucilaginibacter gossypiicola]SEN05570.1 protein of unknown function [Mucilaginibacter gossypiicola]
MSSVYFINKGINKSIEFRGLRAQYIAYLALGLVGLLILFVVLYMMGVNAYVCLTLITGLGVTLVIGTFRLSHKYGKYGLMKKRARRSLPDCLKSRSRKLFIHLKAKTHDQH